MTKLDFLYDLRAALKALPKEDIERYVDYYSEMIDDRIDDGMSEENAVAELGRIEDIASRILGDTPEQDPMDDWFDFSDDFPKEEPQSESENEPETESEPEEDTETNPPKAPPPAKKGHNLSAFAMLLIIFGSPIWLPVLVSLFSVIIGLVSVLFSMVISIYSVPLSLAVIALAFIVWAVYAFIAGSTMYGLLSIGGAFLMAGLAILTLLLSNLIAKLLWRLLKTVFGWIKRLVKGR